MRENCRCQCHTQGRECHPCWQLHLLIRSTLADFESELGYIAQTLERHPSLSEWCDGRRNAVRILRASFQGRARGLGLLPDEIMSEATNAAEVVQ